MTRSSPCKYAPKVAGASAAVGVFAAAFALYAILQGPLGPAGAAAAVAGVAALIVALAGLIAARKVEHGHHHAPKPGAAPDSFGFAERIVEIAKDRPLISIGAALAVILILAGAAFFAGFAAAFPAGFALDFGFALALRAAFFAVPRTDFFSVFFTAFFTAFFLLLPVFAFRFFAMVPLPPVWCFGALTRGALGSRRCTPSPGQTLRHPLPRCCEAQARL